MGEWKTIDTAPKGNVRFYCLIDGLPYIARYDEYDRFCWLNHSNIATGASFRAHEIDGKRLLEETKEAEYNFQQQWNLWKKGFEHKPTHWMPLPDAPTNSKEGI